MIRGLFRIQENTDVETAMKLKSAGKAVITLLLAQ